MIVIRSEYLSTVADLMQGSPRVVANSCKTKGLSIYLERREVVLFSRKKKTEEFVRPEYQRVIKG